MDIKDFYPSLRHALLQQALEKSDLPASVIGLILRAVATRTGTADQPAPTCGVPQGLSISNALAAIYMVEFDKIAHDNIFYRRYVDDILIIAESEKINSVYKSLWAGLKSIGLASHPMGTPGKTETSTLNSGVQYLGYEITPDQISVRQSSLAKMFSNLAKVLTCFRYKQDHARHLFRLNLKISGCIINNSRRGCVRLVAGIVCLTEVLLVSCSEPPGPAKPLCLSDAQVHQFIIASRQEQEERDLLARQEAQRDELSRQQFEELTGKPLPVDPKIDRELEQFSADLRKHLILDEAKFVEDNRRACASR